MNPSQVPPFDDVALVSALAADARICFYEALAHRLTVIARLVAHAAEATDAEKVAEMLAVNATRVREAAGR